MALVQKIFFLVDIFCAFFDYSKLRFVTKHVLSSTHFPSFVFLTFPLKYYLYKKLSCPTKIICYSFLRLQVWYYFEGVFILVSKVTKCALFVRVLEWREIGTDCPEIHTFSFLSWFLIRTLKVYVGSVGRGVIVWIFNASHFWTIAESGGKFLCNDTEPSRPLPPVQITLYKLLL